MRSVLDPRIYSEVQKHRQRSDNVKYRSLIKRSNFFKNRVNAKSVHLSISRKVTSFLYATLSDDIDRCEKSRSKVRGAKLF